MEGKENIVLYDWLSFTSKNLTPEQLIEALGLTHCPWQETKGAHGYRDRKYFSCISVHYNGREDILVAKGYFRAAARAAAGEYLSTMILCSM